MKTTRFPVNARFLSLAMTMFTSRFGGRLYSGLSNVKFSVADTDLQGIIDILSEAKKKIDTYLLSKVAVKSQSQKKGKS